MYVFWLSSVVAWLCLSIFPMFCILMMIVHNVTMLLILRFCTYSYFLSQILILVSFWHSQPTKLGATYLDVFLYYVKFWASFQIHRWIETGVTVRKRSIRVEICYILSCVTFKFDGCLWKTMGASSMLSQASCITSDPSVKSNLSYSPGTPNSCQNWRFLVPRELESWWMILKNKRAPLLYYIKLCETFQIHGWNQTGVAIGKCLIWVKIGNLWSHVTLKCYRWPWKTIGHLSYAASSLCIICSYWWIQIGVTVRKRPIWFKINDFL